MRKVLITGDFDVPPDAFPQDFELIHIRRPRDLQQIIEVLPDVEDYILGGPEYLSATVIDAARDLENLVVMGTGTSSFVDVAYASERGIRIFNTPHLNVGAVVEFTLAMITVCTARVFESIAGVKQGGQWLQTPRPALSSLKIGIVGLGAIGKALARQLKQRGCEQVCYWSRSRDLPLEASLELEYKSLESLVSEVDVVCIHMTYSEQTHSLFDSGLLNRLRPDATIFNLSNPKIICPVALRTFLVTHPDAFCLIDGYYHEWVENRGEAEDPFGLLSLPARNLAVTSHLAAQEQQVVAEIFAQATARVCQLAAQEVAL
ncbi:NAD(P)-dependent oxidoreductase [Pseudomonas sp. Tul1A2]|uniref:NAD(P)-dependent oxidoreductase n=1 Tax=Pseudomonas fluorescens TaxID=294 RepID=UPI00177B2B4C|nr:NAD(P)-dependent oxidoreductase [Pseudomonas fluorescens]